MHRDARATLLETGSWLAVRQVRHTRPTRAILAISHHALDMVGHKTYDYNIHSEHPTTYSSIPTNGYLF